MVPALISVSERGMNGGERAFPIKSPVRLFAGSQIGAGGQRWCRVLDNLGVVKEQEDFGAYAISPHISAEAVQQLVDGKSCHGSGEWNHGRSLVCNSGIYPCLGSLSYSAGSFS